MKETNTKKKYAVLFLSVSIIFILGMFCSCGGSGSSEEETTQAKTKATVTAGEAAAQADENKKAAAQKKTGTEDPAIDAAKAKATEDIEGFDGNWENLSIDVDESITTIDFDWKGTHYQYTFDQSTRQITD